MAVAFSENEKMIIKNKLKEAAEECLEKYGVKKTTVEQLVKMVGISKGAFYIFYESKEVLFFQVLENFQKQIFQEMMSKIEFEKSNNKQLFIEVIYSLFIRVKNSFLINLIKNDELELLYRKLPEDLLVKHEDFDKTLADSLMVKLSLNKKLDAGILSASLRAIFMTLLHEKEIGKKFDEVLKILITGLANIIFLEDEL